MARIIGGNPLGFFSGKMGGVVFAHNKGGQYVRQFVMPVDTKSSAQISARSAFAQAVSAFHTLNGVDKASWNSFASQYFNSKNRGNTPGIHSGVNAFISLRNICINMERTKSAIADVDISVNSTPATAVTGTPIVANSIAPTVPMQGVLDGYSIGAIQKLEFDTSSNKITLGFATIWNATPSAPTPAPSTSSILKDGTGKDVGFAVYASNMIPQSGVFVQNPDIVLLGNTGLIADYTTASIVTADIEIEFAGQISYEGYKNALSSGGVYRLQAYMYNTEGQMLKIGESTIAVA